MTITRECFKQSALRPPALIRRGPAHKINGSFLNEPRSGGKSGRTPSVAGKTRWRAISPISVKPRPTVNTVNPSLGLLPRPTEKDTLYGAILSQLVTGRRSSGAL